MDTIQLKTSLKCDEDFILVTDQAWDYLFKIYGGTDIPRYSIEVSSNEPLDTESAATQTAPSTVREGPKEYIVEVFYKKLQIYILPRNTSHLVLRKPSGIFISRKSTVADFHKKIAEILLPNQKKFNLEQLIEMTRIWRLELGEDVYDIERYQVDEAKEG